MSQPSLSITGRQTSHFTRCTRIFAEELGLDFEYVPIFELMTLDSADYQGNPALKMPVLLVDGEPLFGAINICRELVRLAGSKSRYVWPEDLPGLHLANAQELVSQAMSTEVTIIQSRISGVTADNALVEKAHRSLTNSLEWLESRLPRLLADLPEDRQLSLLEVMLFCLATHLEFREVVSMTPYTGLMAFCQSFGKRPSAKATVYRLDTR